MTDKKKLKIEFAPGCFDDVDISQEELDEIKSWLENMTEEELLAHSVELTDEDLEDLEQSLEQPKRTLH